MTSRPPSRERLNAALREAAEERGIDVQRLRRHLVFQRLLARLSSSQRWVLKGGFALEVRLSDRARATRDLDLALLEETHDVRALLLDELADGSDGFSFEVGPARPARAEDAGGTGWRLSLRCTSDGVEVATVRLDVVIRTAEIEGAIAPLRVRAPVSGLGLDDVEVLAVDVAQHAAEKVHALTREYAGGRPSSRVKDLLDLVLLAEAGLLPDPRWKARLDGVYAARDGVTPPLTLPRPPESWRREYPSLARDSGAALHDLDDAAAFVSDLYARTVNPEDSA